MNDALARPRLPRNAGRFGVAPGEPPWLLNLRVFERHVGVVIALLFVRLNAPLALLLAASYTLRVFALEGIYHRYFAHRSYRAGRAMQFVLAIVGIQCGQRGPLWWSAHHRQHHRATDTAEDPHSPATHSFLYAYLGWFGARANASTDLDAVPELAKFPELRWLDRWYLPVFYAGALAMFLLGHFGAFGPRVDGVSALLWGFYVPSFLQIHAIAMINTFGHMPAWRGGYRRFATRECSVNRPLLALLTLGAGWHNNHHRAPGLARAGFAWYELDVAYWMLRGLQALGLVSAVRGAVPPRVRQEGRLDQR